MLPQTRIIEKHSEWDLSAVWVFKGTKKISDVDVCEDVEDGKLNVKCVYCSTVVAEDCITEICETDIKSTEGT